MIKAVVFTALLLIEGATGHGYMYTPRTRNFLAVEDCTWGSAAGVLYCEDCTSVSFTKIVLSVHKTAGLINP